MPQGTYINKADLIGRFGTKNINSWSQTDPFPDGTSPDTRIQEAIDDAEAYIEGKFRDSLYSVPMTGSSLDFLRAIITDIAGVGLAEVRGVKEDTTVLTKIRTQAEEQIGMVLSGSTTLDLAKNPVLNIPVTP